VGAVSQMPELIVRHYLDGHLTTETNACDH
jgi:hypothetical protein